MQFSCLLFQAEIKLTIITSDTIFSRQGEIFGVKTKVRDG
jgi:hypothetical protein